jgi:predicted Rossmann fold nucleotide-binding protein DprA/Smf involved in DNA uptake
LKNKERQPADLVGPSASETIAICAGLIDPSRLERLLGRGFLLSQAVDRWNSRAIWVVSRADPNYPRRIKAHLRENSPPVLYGCGDASLLETGGLAVVGSRHTDENLTSFSEQVGRLAAESQRTIVSGGAKGIDSAAMMGALRVGGNVIGVMAENLERGALSRENREPLLDNRLVLVSPFDPAAGFSVGHAMQRNKFIYALSDAGLVVTSDSGKGGTWAGAIEQLDKLKYVPIYILDRPGTGKGNSALLSRGGMPWPDPQSRNEFECVFSAPRESGGERSKQDTLPLKLQEDPAEYKVTHVPETSEPESQKKEPAADVESSPEAELLSAVREILARLLLEARTEDEVAKILAVLKGQAKAWLSKLIEEGKVEKVAKSKPVRFRTVKNNERLL